MLVEDLMNCRRGFEAIKADAVELLDQLNEGQFFWQPEPGSWSVGHCIDHLVVTGRDSLSNIRRAIELARLKNLLSMGPFRYSVIDKWLVRQMEPPPRFKMKAPAAYLPKMDKDFAGTAADFLQLQDDFIDCLEAANGINLARVRVQNPVSRLIRFSLGQEFAFNVAHQKRHLWQARLVSERHDFPEGFPRRSAD
jgi:hypothetical protein